MPEQQNTTVTDDWNERTPQPTTSFADDVKRASAKPNPTHRSADELAALVETSAGAAPKDSALAKKAADVAMKDSDVFEKAHARDVAEVHGSDASDTDTETETSSS